jgi:uncharacterized protein (DUF58 family)
LDPVALARLKSLELKMRRVVEGNVSGAHRSPWQGASVEFAEHREYVPGDDVRHIDWKVFARRERFYLKRYELETNLVCNLLVDTSQSMGYGSGEVSKHLYAARAAATLADLVLHHQDAAGLVLFEDRIRYLVQPATQLTVLRQMLHLMDVCQPANVPSRIGETLDELAGRLTGRSLIVLFSDCFDDLAKLENGFKHLKHKRHEIAVFQVLDPREIDFDFTGLTEFEGLEQLGTELVDPRAIRTGYLETFNSWRIDFERICRSSGVEYHLVSTEEPLWQVLAKFMTGRRAA